MWYADAQAGRLCYVVLIWSDRINMGEFIMAIVNRRTLGITIVLAIVLAMVSSAWAEDWPTYRKDNQRSAVTAE